MKKLKLNVLLALILSFGMACSNSAFASRVGEKDLKRTIGRRVVIFTKADIKKERKEEPETTHPATKVQDKTINNPKEKELDDILQYLIEHKENWINLKPLFNVEGWSELPLSSKEFTSEAIRQYEELYCVLENLKVQSIMNGLKREYEVFVDLQRICDEIYSKYKKEQIKCSFDVDFKSSNYLQ